MIVVVAAMVLTTEMTLAMASLVDKLRKLETTGRGKFVSSFEVFFEKSSVEALFEIRIVLGVSSPSKPP